ncbi:IclR family transcriptional regulator [Haloarchaeobius sp. HME9146]|uniref:IclR family transcriptional regulator n=1 Tax=Haloarchaeobius sp. HME9146 TaxID=2978732 RepID=UPI0021BF673E|nr:IclR family transcriptional regulator [Haloarchaeobius sp. HME9146]MCT9098056.1 IclR family transcriptional regulator [Haloarchaeobius sp. HME9146]
MTDPMPGSIRSDETLLSIVEAVEALGEAGVTEIADQVDVSKSTVHGHLTTLKQQGYVVAEEGRYRLSLRFLQLGEHTRTQTGIYNLARPHVDELARETNELANLAVEENGRGVYLYRTQGDQTIQFSTDAGDVHQLHCSATGKSMLAHMPREHVDEILDEHGLPAHTEQTITDEATLHETLVDVRERGVAFDDEEYGEGLRCVGAPIRGPEGDVLGAISVSGPATRLPEERYREELPDMLRRAANLIEINLKQY